MGNNCTSEVLVVNSIENKHDPFEEGCLAGCVSQKVQLNPDVDEAEFQTHDKSQVPKGKISINSIAYLTKEEISFLKACAGKNVSAIRYYIKRNVNVNLLDEDRTSPLHVACRSGGLQVVEELINHGANLDMADIAGWTPLHIAANYQRALICHILLKKGANPYHLSRMGETPWDLVKEKNTEEIFFIHFDRVELRKMSKSRAELAPGEPIDEVARVIDLKPRENIVRSFIELEFKRSLKEQQENSLSKRQSTKAEETIKGKLNKTPSEASSQGSKAGKLFMEDKHFADEGTPVKRENEVKEKKTPSTSDQPKKHKYYKYFKKMKIVHMKNLKEANDALYTLQSDEGSSDDSVEPKSACFEAQSQSMMRTDEIEALERKPSTKRSRNVETRKNSMKGISVNASYSNISVVPSHNRLEDKFNTTSRSILQLHQTFGINQLIQKDHKDIEILQFDSNLLKENDKDFLSLPELTHFKLDTRFQENVHKMGIELFNHDSLKGISFLMLFKLLKKSPKDIAQFLYKSEANLNYKKNVIEVTNLLTNMKLKESREILEYYGNFYNYTGMTFFESLKHYISDFALDNDPEKIDWLLRGFASQYHKKMKTKFKLTSEDLKFDFETPDSVRMLAFVALMLNIECQYDENPPNTLEEVEQLRRDFILNVSGLNDGENFKKNLINEVFEKARSSKLIKFIGKDYFHEKSKKIAFRSAKLALKVQKQSNKEKKLFKEYYLYFNGPVCFVVKVKDNSSVPKSLFMLTNLTLKNHKNQNIHFTPQSASNGPIVIADFTNNGIIIKSKSELYYNLYGVDDYRKIENYIKSI